MITIFKSQSEFYIRITDVSTPEFNAILLVLRSKGLKYVSGKGSTHSNPKILLDTIYELNDNFETFVSDKIKKEIEEFNPYVPSFKPRRFKINELYFEKFPPLYPEQRDDAIRMAQYGRFALFLKQGLGKTYITIQAINQLFYNNLADRILIVVIPWMMYNWKRELLQFSDLFKEEDFLIVTEANRDVMFNKALPKIVITSYSTLRLCSDYAWKQENPYKEYTKPTKEFLEYCEKKKINWEKINDEQKEKINKKIYLEKQSNYRKEQIDFSWWGNNRIFIQDESHKSKNMNARWTQILHKEKKFFDFRFPLTGTPHPNGIQELYSNIKFIDDNLVDKDYVDFLRSIGTVGTKFSEYQLDSIDEDKANKFLERIKPYFSRRELRDMVSLPDVHYKKVYIPLQGKQKQLYQQLVEQELVSIKDNKGAITYNDVKVKFPYLMSALSDPLLLDGKLTNDLLSNWKFEDSIKVQTCTDIIESLFEDDEDQKIIIWEEHPKSIDRLGKLYAKYNPIIIHGEVDTGKTEKYKWRDEQVDLFRKDKSRKILIANPITLGTGQNLQFCKSVIYFSRNGDFVNWDQSLKRTDRIGMSSEVKYYILIIDNSLDVHIDKILVDRETLDRLFLKQGLTTKDCKDIFAGSKV